MTDYSKLVEALREAKKHMWKQPQIELYPIMDDAAAAIEALQAEVERLKDSNEELREKQTVIDHYGTEWMTSAKDVPTAAYKHGYADGMAEVKAQLPKRGEWIHNTAVYGTTTGGLTVEHHYTCSVCGGLMGRKGDKFCYNCGAKMEVQE